MGWGRGPWDEEIDFHTPSQDIVSESSHLQEAEPSSWWITLVLSGAARPLGICEDLHLPCECPAARGHDIKQKIKSPMIG